VHFTKSKRKQLLRNAFGEGHVDASEKDMSLHCPKCNDGRRDKYKLIVHLETGWFHCWVCGLSGKNISYLFRKFAPSYFRECCELFEVKNTSQKPSDEPVVEPVKLPDDAMLVLDSKDPDARSIVAYLKGRGMSNIDIYRWRVCFSNEFRFRRKAIFPSFDADGKLNYYVARSIDDTKFKYSNAKVAKSTIIFNELDIDWRQPVILVEGVFDAIKCPDNTIPVLGSTLPKSSLLHKTLSKYQTPVIVAFDEDAEQKAHRVCGSLAKAGCDVYKAKISGGDLGSKKKEEAMASLETTQKWTTESLITHKISSIKSGSIL